MESTFLKMLEKLGRGDLPRLIVGPAIVRGSVASTLHDLNPLREAAGDIAPAGSMCITVSIGANLSEAGEIVMNLARTRP